MENKPIYLEIMGDYPINRVLNFLVVYDQFDYSLTDIAKNAKVSYSTLMAFWKELEETKIVAMSRKVGKAKMFKLNKENTAVKQFIQFYWSIVKAETEQFLAPKLVA